MNDGIEGEKSELADVERILASSYRIEGGELDPNGPFPTLGVYDDKMKAIFHPHAELNDVAVGIGESESGKIVLYLKGPGRPYLDADAYVVTDHNRLPAKLAEFEARIRKLRR